MSDKEKLTKPEKLRKLKQCIDIFAISFDPNTKTRIYNTSTSNYINNLLEIWSIFDSLLNVEQDEFTIKQTPEQTPEERMKYIFNESFGGEAYLRTNSLSDKLKLIRELLTPTYLSNLIIDALQYSAETKDPSVLSNFYDEKIRHFLIELFVTENNSSPNNTDYSDELIEDIIGFKKVKGGVLGCIEIHAGVGRFLPGRNKYCETLIKTICEKLLKFNIKFIISDTVRDKCFGGEKGWKVFENNTKKNLKVSQENAITQGYVILTSGPAGGRSSRRRKAYKTTRRNNKNKNKKQYRRKRHTKRCKKSHRRIRR